MQTKREFFLPARFGYCFLSCPNFPFYQENAFMKIGAFVVIPDHYHLAFQLGEKTSLDKLIWRINRYVSSKVPRRIKSKEHLWQPSYHDHRIRTFEDLSNQLAYIENNPIRKGLTSEPSKWLYSSAYPKWKEFMDRSWCW